MFWLTIHHHHKQSCLDDTNEQPWLCSSVIFTFGKAVVNSLS